MAKPAGCSHAMADRGLALCRLGSIRRVKNRAGAEKFRENVSDVSAVAHFLMAHAAAAVARPRPLALRIRRAPATRVGGRLCTLGDGRAASSWTRRRVAGAPDAGRDVEIPLVAHGDPDADLGDSAGPFRGVVTRRHTLGRKLTFVDLTCAAPTSPPEPGEPGDARGARETSSSREDDDDDVFIFAKCWGVVDKRVKPGATVLLRATHTRHLTTPPRPRDAEAQKLTKGGSARVSVAEDGVALVAPPSAAESRNAEPFLVIDPTVRHKETVRQKHNTSSSRLCRSFVARGACGDPRCIKRHAFASDAEREATASSKRAAARRSAAAVAEERDPLDPHGDASRAGKQHSDRLFAAWLVETFELAPAALDDGSAEEAARAAGEEPPFGGFRNREGSETDSRAARNAVRKKVADIAGGGGTLSFELHVRHGCECVLVDPAFVALSPRQLATWRNLRKRAARSGERGGAWRAWRRAERWVRVAAEERDARRDAHVRRVLVNTDAARGDDGDSKDDRSLDKRGARVVDSGGKQSGDDADVLEDEDVARFEHFAEEFWGDLDGVLGSAIRDCDVLVGMHPDQATEPIIDAALRLNKPFAVVPCCVFPDLFPERVARDGAPVRSYAQFLEYLRSKDPGIETAYLPFQGRSRVLYKR